MFGRFTGRNSATESKSAMETSTSTTTVVSSTQIEVSGSSSPHVKSNSELGLPREEDFVNHGYARWMEVRDQWKNGTGRFAKPAGPDRNYNEHLIRTRPRTNSNLDAEEIVERIFANKPSAMVLPEPVPLGQMVDVLLDVWEADGLYD